MRKNCAICGNKVGLAKLKMSDGYICNKCLVSSGWGSGISTSYGAIFWAKKHSTEDFKNFTKNGGTNKEAAKEWANNQNQKIKDMQAVQRTTESQQSIDFNDELAKKEAKKINNWDIDKRIKEQLINAKVIDLFGVKKELRYLSNILGENEPIKYACSGIVDGRTVLVVCTNSRVIFLNKNMVIGMQQEEIPLEFVNAVSCSQGITLGSISVTNGANTTLIEKVSRSAAPIMSKAIKDTAQVVRNENNTNNSSADDSLSTLKKLKELADSGVITQDEFETKKKEILDKI